MLINNIKEDFDKLRGDKTYEDVGNILGVKKQAVHADLMKRIVVSPVVSRIFESIGYDIAFTYVPRGTGAVSAPEIQKQTGKHVYIIRRGYVRLGSYLENTSSNAVSAASVLESVLSEKHDLTSLQVSGTFENTQMANAFYQSQRKDLHSHDEGRLCSIAEVVTISVVDPDGVETPMKQWAGSIKRPVQTYRGKPKSK